MDNDEIKRLAKEIAEHSVDYTGYDRAPAPAPVGNDAYPRQGATTGPERAGEQPDELRIALLRWLTIEIDKSAEMAVIRQRVSFITAFTCIMIKLFIVGVILVLIIRIILSVIA